LAGTPILTSMNPAGGRQDQTVSSVITGQLTNWVQGTTTLNLGAGITVNSVTVTSPTSLTVPLTRAANASIGDPTGTVSTGAEVVVVANAFTVQVGAPVLLSVTPNFALPGQMVTVTITSQFTNFAQGTTQASFGERISVGGGPLGGFGPITVNSPTSAT